MKSTYAHGRSTLPAPTITLQSGTIQGGNTTYYFWLKARNRVGCNSASEPTSISIPNNKQITISASSFATFGYEDWRYIYVVANTTNNFNTGHIIYKQRLYEDDQVTPITISDVIINSDRVLNGSTEVAAITDLNSLGASDGYRIKVTAVNKIYEFTSTEVLTVDNITVIAGSEGIWKLVSSNSLNETDTNATKEIYQVTKDEFLNAALPSVTQDPVAIKYYIHNNAVAGLEAGELQLNAYVSDSTLDCTFDVEVLGYLSLDTFLLDTTGIDYVNTVVTYPDTKIRLSKTLPANSVFVLKVTPNVALISAITKGTYVSLYPKISAYTTIESLAYVGEPVADLDALRALPSGSYIAGQSRYVTTQRQDYVFDPDSTTDDDGDTVITPNSNPVSGRWIVKSSSVPAESITLAKLSNEVVLAFTPNIKTTTVNITTSQTYAINLDSVSVYDYYVVNTPTDDGSSTIINLTGTLSNNTSKAVIIELRQNTGTVEFHSSILFPGGNIPLLSGNGKNDLFVLSIIKDSTGTLKKRGFMVQKDIG